MQVDVIAVLKTGPDVAWTCYNIIGAMLEDLDLHSHTSQQTIGRVALLTSGMRSAWVVMQHGILENLPAG
jgi:hypothetical protein